MFKILLAFPLLLFLGACGDYGDCVYPDTLTKTKYEVKVDARKTTWTEAGFDVLDTERLLINIMNKGVNVCMQEAQVLVDPINSGWTSSGISLEKGDHVSFTAVPVLDKVELTDCNNPPSGIKVNDVDKCKNGFEMDINGVKKKTPPYEGRFFTALVGSDINDKRSNLYGQWPHNSNKWIPNLPIVMVPDIYDTDDRLPPLPQDVQDVVDKLSTDARKGQEKLNFRCGRGNYRSRGPDTRISAYTLNDLCDNFCTKDNSFSGCVYTIEAVPTKTERIQGEDVPIESDQYFSQLIAKIGGSQNIPDAEPDHVGFAYAATSNKQKSIKINYSYEAIADGLLTLHIYDIPNYFYDNKGGYHVNVERSCPKKSEESLYMYIGKTPPRMNSNGTFSSMNGVFKIGADSEYRINDDNTPTKGDVHFIVAHDFRSSNVSAVGEFVVLAEKPRDLDANISVIIEGVENWVKDTLYGKSVNGKRSGGVVTRIYNNITGSTYLKKTIQAMLILYVAIYTVVFLVGLSRASQRDLIITLLKFALLLQLTATDSWDFFYGYLFTIFNEGTQELIALFSHNGEFNSSTRHFAFVDQTLGRFLIMETWMQLFGMLFAGPIGWIYLLLIFWGVWVYICAIVSAVIVYLMCLVMVGLLCSIAPIFIACILFKYTQKMFTNWIKVLTNNLVQPVMIFAGLSFLNQIMNVVIYNLLGYGVCQGCAITMEISDGNIGNFCLASFPMPIGYEPNEDITSRGKCFENTADDSSSVFLGLPMMITNIIIFLIVAYLIKKFVTFAAEMADSITENFYGGVGSPGGGAYAFEQDVLGLIGQDDASKNRRFRQQVYEERYKSLMDPAKIDVVAKDGGEENSRETTARPDVDIKTGGGTAGPPGPSLLEAPERETTEGEGASTEETGRIESVQEEGSEASGDEAMPRDSLGDLSAEGAQDIPEEVEEERESEEPGAEREDEADRSVPREAIRDMDSGDEGDEESGDEESGDEASGDEAMPRDSLGDLSAEGAQDIPEEVEEERESEEPGAEREDEADRSVPREAIRDMDSGDEGDEGEDDGNDEDDLGKSGGR